MVYSMPVMSYNMRVVFHGKPVMSYSKGVGLLSWTVKLHNKRFESGSMLVELLSSNVISSSKPAD